MHTAFGSANDHPLSQLIGLCGSACRRSHTILRRVRKFAGGIVLVFRSGVGSFKINIPNRYISYRFIFAAISTPPLRSDLVPLSIYDQYYLVPIPVARGESDLKVGLPLVSGLPPHVCSFCDDRSSVKRRLLNLKDVNHLESYHPSRVLYSSCGDHKHGYPKGYLCFIRTGKCRINCPLRRSFIPVRTLGPFSKLSLPLAYDSLRSNLNLPLKHCYGSTELYERDILASLQRNLPDIWSYGMEAISSPKFAFFAQASAKHLLPARCRSSGTF